MQLLIFLCGNVLGTHENYCIIRSIMTRVCCSCKKHKAWQSISEPKIILKYLRRLPLSWCNTSACWYFFFSLSFSLVFCLWKQSAWNVQFYIFCSIFSRPDKSVLYVDCGRVDSILCKCVHINEMTWHIMNVVPIYLKWHYLAFSIFFVS